MELVYASVRQGDVKILTFDVKILTLERPITCQRVFHTAADGATRQPDLEHLASLLKIARHLASV